MSTEQPGDNVAVTLIIILIFIIIGLSIWWVNAATNLRTCQTTESPLCPVFYCQYTNQACANGSGGPNFPLSGPAYRHADGTIMCQGATIPVVVANSADLASANFNLPPS